MLTGPTGFLVPYLLAYLLAGAALLALFRRWRRPSLPRLAAGNAAVFLLLGGAVFLAGEAWFTFAHDTTDGAMVLLTSKRWMLRHWRPNRLGFRGKEPPIPAGPRGEGLEIALLGDSFTFGQGIRRAEDRFGEVLEGILRREGRPATVYNLGRMGWNIRDEVTALGDLLARGARFDLVVLAFVPNDHFGQQELPPGYQAAVERARNPPGWIAPALDHSFFLSFLYHRITLIGNPELQGYDRMAGDLFQRREIRERFQGVAQELIELCRLGGARLAVVTFPLTIRPWEEYPLRGMHRSLARMWRLLGVPHLDLLPAWSAHPLSDLAVGPYDTHPNELANRLAAEAIAGAFFPPGVSGGAAERSPGGPGPAP